MQNSAKLSSAITKTDGAAVIPTESSSGKSAAIKNRINAIEVSLVGEIC